MSVKVFIFVVMVFVLVPAVSLAIMMVPQADLTVVINTEKDNTFTFNLSSGTSFDLQTQNFIGSNVLSIVAFGDSYTLSQNTASGLKINSILCNSDNPSVVFDYTDNSVSFTPVLNEDITCTFENVKTRTPVLIVPGLGGTEIKDGNDLLWLDLGKAATDIGDSFMDPLQFNQNLSPSVLNLQLGSVVKEPILTQHYYDLILNEFERQGYVEGQDLFTFPYDWRYGVTGHFSGGGMNSDLLADKITDILNTTSSTSVDVVAHSLGGLITKKYVQEHLADNYINKAIFVGVPNTGSPDAVKALLTGSNFGIPWLSNDEIKKLAENMPAVYDVLPSQQYYNTKGSFVGTIDYYPSDLSYFKKDLDYQETESFLIQDYNLNQQAFDNAENLHTQSFDDFDLRTAGVDVYAIDGCKKATLTKIVRETWHDVLGQDLVFYKSPEYLPGDGTVPLESATNLPIDAENKYYFLKADHAKMLSQDGSRQKIVNLISGSNLNTGTDFWGNDYITQDINKCNLKGKAISVFSPVDIFVTDQDGNQLGLAGDGSIQNEIPGADFEILGDPATADRRKFLFLPTDNSQTYTISLTGIDTGTFTIKVDDISENQIQTTEVFNNFFVTSDSTGQLILNSSDGSATIVFQQTSSGPAETFEPTAVLTPGQSLDFLPPKITVSFSGTQDEDKNYISNITISLSAQDPVIQSAENQTSGVQEILYQIDDETWQEQEGDSAEVVISVGAGDHIFNFYSIDRAGNKEQTQTINFTMITVKSVGGGNSYTPTNESVPPTPISTPAVSVQTEQSKLTPVSVSSGLSQLEVKNVDQVVIQPKPLPQHAIKPVRPSYAAAQPPQPPVQEPVPAPRESIVSESALASLQNQPWTERFMNYFKNAWSMVQNWVMNIF